MASKSASILLVKVGALPAFPQVFQDHVAKYFAPVTVFGVACMYAFEDSNGHVANCAGGRNVLGVAPSHSGHLRAKVTDEITLSDWMSDILADKTQSNFIRISGHWNDGTIDFPPD